MVVDAYGSPTIADDLMQFDEYLGLGTPPLRIVKVGNVPAFDSSNADMIGWASETTLDVEYAHAGAPGAKLVLVEVAKEDLQHLALAVQYAVQHKLGNVISLSWGAPEQAVGPESVAPTVPSSARPRAATSRSSPPPATAVRPASRTTAAITATRSRAGPRPART